MKFLLAAAAVAAALVPAAASAQRAGDWVLAPWQTGQYLYPGVVQSTSGGMVNVRFDDGSSRALARNTVRRFDWAAGSRIECRWQNGQRWYRGRIDRMGRDGATIDITYADGDRETTNTGRCRVPA